MNSNPFCALGRLDLIMRHTLAFAGSEGLALFDLSLVFVCGQYDSPQGTRLGLGAPVLQRGSGLFADEQLPPQLFKAPPLALTPCP